MGLLKRVLFIIIPIATLLIALAYGIELLFGSDLTYLGWTSPTGQFYANVYDFKSYLQGLELTDIAEPIKNAVNTIYAISKPLNNMQEIWKNGYNIGDITITIINIFILLLDMFIWILNIIISILQTALIIIFKILSLFGIRITGSTNPLAVAFNAIKDWKQIPLLSGIQAISSDLKPIHTTIPIFTL